MIRLIDIDKRFDVVGRQTLKWLKDYEAFKKRKLTPGTRATSLFKLETRLLWIDQTFCQLLLENMTKIKEKYDTKEIAALVQKLKDAKNDLERESKWKGN